MYRPGRFYRHTETKGDELRSMTNDDVTLSVTPITFESADPADPRQFAAWAVGHFPDPRNRGMMVPLGMPSATAPEFSQLLNELGFRHHPELMTKFPIPGEQPGMGWLNPPKYVTRNEYDAYWATHKPQSSDAATTAVTGNALQRMLAALNPELAKRIDAMTPEERAAALPEAERAAVPAFERLAALREALKKVATDE